LILDTLAKVYGGDENVRMQVTQFIGFLDKIAIKYHVAIIVLLHPSLSGRNTGTGESGSTGWHGSMRAGAAEEGREPDRYLRQLAVKKNNYGLSGETINLRWERGRYVLVSGKGSFERAAEEAKVDEAYIRLLKRRIAQNLKYVSPNSSPSQAARVCRNGRQRQLQGKRLCKGTGAAFG
jgi:RecA-family ATPase